MEGLSFSSPRKGLRQKQYYGWQLKSESFIAKKDIYFVEKCQSSHLEAIPKHTLLDRNRI